MQRYNKLLIQTNILGEIYLKWYRFRPFLWLEPLYSVLMLLIGFSEALLHNSLILSTKISILPQLHKFVNHKLV
jgi:hypothetical protein